MTRVDWATGVAPYEFYREKAWQVSPRVSIYHATCLLYHVSDQPRPRPSRRGDPLHQERGGAGQEAQVSTTNSEHCQYPVSQVCDIGAAPRGLAAGRDHRGHHHLLRRDEEQGAEGLREARAAAAEQQHSGGVIVSKHNLHCQHIFILFCLNE